MRSLACLPLVWVGALSIQSAAARPAPPVHQAADPAPQEGLPDAPGRALVERVCGSCHGMADTTDTRRTAPEWRAVVDLMKAYGAVASDDEWSEMTAYLIAQLANLNVNEAPAEDMAVFFAIDEESAQRVVAYRGQQGGFKTVEDVKRVPGVNAEKVEAVKTRLVF